MLQLFVRGGRCEGARVQAFCRGPFHVKDASGRDRTPRGMKDRGLLALLVLSPGQRRTRQWLQDKLWSDRTPEQAAHSCRQSLSALRQALGPDADKLVSDRATVWLAPPFEAVLDGPGEVLADLDIRDPEFTDWLRDCRQSLSETQLAIAEPPRAGRSGRGATILIRRCGSRTTDRAEFLTSMILTRIEQSMAALGDVAVLRGDENAEAHEAADALAELESIEHEDCWFVMLRVYDLPARHVLWTGRLTLPLAISTLWNSSDLIRLVNQATSVLSDRVASGGRLTAFAAIHKAVRRIYDFEADRLAAADDLLQRVEAEDQTGLVLAWRGFICLTAAIEYRHPSSDVALQALDHVQAALRRQATHPVSLALASQVHIKLGDDFDRALYLARRAVAGGEANPYALDALAQAQIRVGDPTGGYSTAMLGRQAAQGLPHAFVWDMQCCLSALALDLVDDARAFALTAHRQMPFYRPPLRYLVALSLLSGRHEEADHYAQKLKRYEPDFTATLLLRPDYPVHTLRDLGYADHLRSELG